MHYEETDRIEGLLMWVIVITAVIGLVGGIFMGNTFAVVGESLYSFSEPETEWGFASVIAMIFTWLLTFIACVLLYEKKCRIEMLDDIAGKIYSIEKSINNRK